MRAGLMFSYIFLLIASLMIVKPVRNSLFLTQFGIEQLPYAFIAVAVVSAGFVGAYSRLTRRFKLNRIIVTTTVVSILSLSVVWWLLMNDFKAPWFIYAFYVWVALFGLITTTQFWLLANYVFNAREAKRVFSFVGAGAIAGGIFGGYLTNFLATTLSTKGMLHFAMLFLVVCLVLLSIVWKSGAKVTYRERLRRQARQRELSTSGSPLKLLLQSRLVTYTASIIGVGVIAASLVDYSFNAVASEAIQDPDRLTAFFGFWMSNLSVFSLLIQLIVTGRALKSFGVGIALLFLPVAVLVGAGAIILMPTLVTVTALKVSEGGFKQSIQKVGIELLGLPVPARLKNQIKALVDVAVDNFATGIGGLLLLLLTVVLNVGVQFVGALIVLISFVWIFLVIKVRKEYVDSFRHAIEKRTIDPEAITRDVKATVHADDLIRLLDSSNEKQIIFALGFYESLKDERLADHLKVLADHSSSEVQRRVFTLAREIPDVDLTAAANLYIAAGNARVRIAAMRYLLSRSEHKLELIQFYMADDDVIVRAAALISAAREWKDDADFRAQVDIEELFRNPCAAITVGAGEQCEKEVRIALAHALGIVSSPTTFDCLDQLLTDEAEEVAAQVVISAGRTHDLRFVPQLIEALGSKHLRRQAREALSEYGESIGELLDAQLSDPNTSTRIRFEIPRILAMIGSQSCVKCLLNNLDHPNTALRYQVIRSLNKIRAREPNLKLKTKQIDERITDETRRYYYMLLVLHRHRQISQDAADASPEVTQARSLLMRALSEKLDSNLERIFRLLGLKHLPKDMYNAYYGVVSELPDNRANAVELLDLVLDPRLKEIILPLAEIRDDDSLVGKCEEMFSRSTPSEDECLSELLTGDDDWLRVCALYLIAMLKEERFLDIVVNLKTHWNSVVRETAEFAERNLTLRTGAETVF